jgi:hypothetical protein
MKLDINVDDTPIRLFHNANMAHLSRVSDRRHAREFDDELYRFPSLV